MSCSASQGLPKTRTASATEYIMLGLKEHGRCHEEVLLQVTEDTEGMRFNTAIAAMMEFMNSATKWEQPAQEVLEGFVLLLSPYAPHLAEELWQVRPCAPCNAMPMPLFDAKLWAACSCLHCRCLTLNALAETAVGLSSCPAA